MRRIAYRIGGIGKYVAAAGIVLLGAGLLVDAPAAGRGIREGLGVCANVLIPSLFPFMVLSCFLSLTKYARILSRPLAPLTTRLFKLPGELGYVVLLSLIGGYPVGAKAIAALLKQGRLDKATAERMLGFCVNSGPSFLISAVGAGMLGDRKTGTLLFAAQITATLLIGFLFSWKEKPPQKKRMDKSGELAGAAAFVAAVTTASSAMIAMCAFAVLFSGFISMLTASGLCYRLAELLHVDTQLMETIAGGVLEVTTGCTRGAKLGGPAGVLLVSAFVSFGGISVLFQVMSCFEGMQVRFRPLIMARIAHAALTCAMVYPFRRNFHAVISVWMDTAQPITDSGNMWGACAVLVCAALTLVLATSNWKNKPKQHMVLHERQKCDKIT